MNGLQIDYALKTASLGAGVQSSTIVEMILEGELPPVDAVIFADTGDEPQYVYDQVNYLAGRLEKVNIPLVTVSAGNMIDDIYSGKRLAAMPLFTKRHRTINGFGTQAETFSIGRLRRQCTREYKIEPIEKWVRQELLRRGWAKQNKAGAIRPLKGVQIQTWLGISWDEIDRMKPNKVKWINNHWSLIDLKMRRADCIEWLSSRGLPIPKKSACRRCPYHSKAYFRQMRDGSLDDWAEVVKFDHDLRNGELQLSAKTEGDLYMTRECIPLEEIDLDSEQDNGQIDMCDEGYCFI